MGEWRAAEFETPELEGSMGTMNAMFEEREVRERVADKWWIFLLTGIAWLIFALIVFQWSYASVTAISYLFGVVLLVAAVNELFQLAVSTTGWKFVHGILCVLFTLGGIF